MIPHTSLGDSAFKRSRRLKTLIENHEITLAGNIKLKMYGRLDCTSGKRMKAQNRIFFSSAAEALDSGYRPCRHCMRAAYKQWKAHSAAMQHHKSDAVFCSPRHIVAAMEDIASTAYFAKFEF